MKKTKPNILTEEAQTETQFFNKQGGQSSFFTKPANGTNSGAAVVQRKCDECEKEDEQVQKKEMGTVQKKEEGSADSPPPPETEMQATTVPATPSSAVTNIIVEDTETPDAGQIRKTELLARLKTEICDSVNQALTGTPFSADSCPYIKASFEKHQNSSPATIEALIHRYAPATAQATTAEALIQGMKARAYTASLQWVQNGGNMSEVMQIFDGTGEGIGSAIGNVVSGIGSMFFKSDTGGAKASTTQSPKSVMNSLGKGAPIESGTRSKMEDAFGTSFSDVEIHTDSHAAKLSGDMNARAFTVGNHIAFGSGEHQPGNIVSDALMAHELAHTVQQSGSNANDTGSDYAALEEDADNASVGAIGKMLTGKELPREKKKSPKAKAGLKLSRCSGCGGDKEKKPEPQPPKMIDEPTNYASYELWLASFPPYDAVSGDKDLMDISPPGLKALIAPSGGFVCDCADVSIMLKHYYHKMKGTNYTFKAGGGGSVKEYKLGAGVTDDEVRKIAIQIGSINFQDDRGGRKDTATSMISFYKKGQNRLTNLSALIDAGLKPGDVFVWKKIDSSAQGFDGHVQTVQSVDTTNGVITFVQGNMSAGVGTGNLQQRVRTYYELTGDPDGRANILPNNGEESFFGAGPWK